MGVDTTKQKRCPHCGQWLERETAFPRNPMTRDGLSSWCRDCHREAVREHRARRAARARLLEE
jgi:hypothetical protein